MTNPPQIEFIEWFDAVDVRTVKLVCRELPKGHGCRITRDRLGWLRKTKANGKGSIRYCLHGTLDSAYEAARQWAERKVAEARREAAR